MVRTKCLQKVPLGLGGRCSKLNVISSGTDDKRFFQTGFPRAFHGNAEGDPRSPRFPGPAGGNLPAFACGGAPPLPPPGTGPDRPAGMAAGPEQPGVAVVRSVPTTGYDFVLSRVRMGPFLDVNMTSP